MFAGSVRDDALVAQRYDLSKRRKPSTLSISTTFYEEAQIRSPKLNDYGLNGPESFDDGHMPEGASTSTENSECDSPIELEDDGWVSHAAARRAAASGLLFRSSYHSDDSGFTAIDADADLSEIASRSTSTLLDGVTSDSEAKDIDDSDLSIEDDLDDSEERIKFIDVFETEDFTITRTIIRPAISATGRRLKTRSFSFLTNGRKSSSSSLKGLKLMRSTPSFPRHLGYLGSGRTAESFEEDLDALQKKRELEQQGKHPELRVRIDVEKSVYAEERWRDAIHTLLYGHLPRTTTGVSGHIEVVS